VVSFTSFVTSNHEVSLATAQGYKYGFKKQHECIQPTDGPLMGGAKLFLKVVNLGQDQGKVEWSRRVTHG